MTEETQAPTKGQGRISVSPGVEPEGVQIPRFGQVAFDLIEVKPMFDLWQSRLLLPDGYSIVAVYFDIMRKLWVLAVESEGIPLTPSGEMVPELMPGYQYADDGKIKLTDIKIWDNQARKYRTLWEGKKE